MPLAFATPILIAAMPTAGCGTEPGTRPAEAEPAAPVDPLPAWAEGPAKLEILDFVRRVTTAGSPAFVPPAERIAVFDNDGTLWTEQPYYVQLAFAFDRVEALAPKHPEWRHRQPFKGVLERDLGAVARSGEKGIMELLAATHVGNTTDEFATIVGDWITIARHPRFDRPYTDLVYQPMLEVLAYLRASGFRTFIVSGGGVEFMRPWVERVYGVPPEQVIGSRAKVRYELVAGIPFLTRLPAVDLVDDKAGKPVGIHQVIGRRPIIAFGNSDGDLEMLEWTTVAPGKRLGVVVHHTDAAREWAYDRDSRIGHAARILDEAGERGWLVVDMKRDWRVVYPFQGRYPPSEIETGSSSRHRPSSAGASGP
jgi:hypothetical protein